MTMTYLRSLLACAAVFAAGSITAFSQYRGGDAYSKLYDSETVTSLKEHVSYLSSADKEGRKAGSEGELLAAEYLYEKLSEYGIDMLVPPEGDEFGIARESGDTLISRNVYGFVQGYDKNLRDKYIVVGARLDNLGTNIMTVDGKTEEQIYYGANGNASGVALMIELARMVSTNSILFRRSVIFIGFGSSCSSYAGAWYFLNRSFSDADKIEAMINLDMLGTGSDGFYAYTASNIDLNGLVGKLAEELQPVHPELVASEPYPSDHRAFYSSEIPAVYFTSGRYPEHNTYRDDFTLIDFPMMEKELEYIYNFTVSLANYSGNINFREPAASKRGPSYDDVVAYYDCDQRPMFLNSADPRQFMEKWVYAYLKYPPEAVRDGIQGTVLVDFIIDKDGKVTDARVLRSVDPLLDAEALRVISASPKWRPGRVNGNKVRTSMTVSVEFRLQKKGEGKKIGIKK